MNNTEAINKLAKCLINTDKTVNDLVETVKGLVKIILEQQRDINNLKRELWGSHE